MSLINDALKRAQQTTGAQEPPRLDGAELRPIEPGRQGAGNEGDGAKRIIWIGVLLVVTCNIVLWILFKDRGSDTRVEARTAEVEPIPPVATEPAPDSGAVIEIPAAPKPEEPVPAPTSATVAAASEPHVLVTESFVGSQPQFRLNTIVSHPVRPSAMINNRIVFVGDQLEGYTVKSITTQHVILVLGDDEVVVSLP